MSRINTNVSSLIAQKTLARSNAQLQESLSRLQHRFANQLGQGRPGRFDRQRKPPPRHHQHRTRPSRNSERANQLIATADSALGQISNLLNDIRGLVVEAANTGVLSDEQIAANQLQVDSSLEAIDRIAQVTTFQGRKLLDGSLDFQVAYTAGGATVRDLDIQQANLGTAGSVNVEVDITTAATQALITNAAGFAPSAAQQASGLVTLTNTTATINITAVAGSAADGTVGNTTDVVFQAAAGIAQSTGTFTLANTGGTFDITASPVALPTALTGDSVAIIIAEGAGPTAATYNATLNAITVNVDNSIVGGDTVANIAAAVDALGRLQHLDRYGRRQSVRRPGRQHVQRRARRRQRRNDGRRLCRQHDHRRCGPQRHGRRRSRPRSTAWPNSPLPRLRAAAWLSTRPTSAPSTTRSAAAWPPPSTTCWPPTWSSRSPGPRAAEVFTFEAGATLSQIVNAVNLVSDATGVEAANNAGVLELRSTGYGSAAIVDVEVLEEGSAATFEAGLERDPRRGHRRCRHRQRRHRQRQRQHAEHQHHDARPVADGQRRQLRPTSASRSTAAVRCSSSARRSSAISRPASASAASTRASWAASTAGCISSARATTPT